MIQGVSMQLTWGQKIGEPFYVMELTETLCYVWLLVYNERKLTWTVENVVHQELKKNIIAFSFATNSVQIDSVRLKQVIEEIFCQLEYQSSIRVSSVVCLLGDIFIEGNLSIPPTEPRDYAKLNQKWLTFSYDNHTHAQCSYDFSQNSKITLLHQKNSIHKKAIPHVVSLSVHNNIAHLEPKQMIYKINYEKSINIIEKILENLSFSLQYFEMATYMQAFCYLKSKEWNEGCFVISLEYNITSILLVHGGNILGMWKMNGILSLMDMSFMQYFSISLTAAQGLREACGFGLNLWENEDSYDIIEKFLPRDHIQNYSMTEIIQSIQRIAASHLSPIINFLLEIEDQKIYHIIEKPYQILWMGLGGCMLDISEIVWSKMEYDSHRIITADYNKHFFTSQACYSFCSEVNKYRVEKFFTQQKQQMRWASLVGCIKMFQSWC